MTEVYTLTGLATSGIQELIDELPSVEPVQDVYMPDSLAIIDKLLFVARLVLSDETKTELNSKRHILAELLYIVAKHESVGVVYDESDRGGVTVFGVSDIHSKELAGLLNKLNHTASIEYSELLEYYEMGANTPFTCGEPLAACILLGCLLLHERRLCGVYLTPHIHATMLLGKRRAGLALQRTLNELDSVGLLVDGIIGSRTEAAIASSMATKRELTTTYIKHVITSLCAIDPNYSDRYIRGWILRFIRLI